MNKRPIHQAGDVTFKFADSELDEAALQGHTPGPWRFRFDPSVNYGRFESQANDLPLNDPVVLAVREDWVRYLDETREGRANARLMAAAPEMLQALRAVVDALLTHQNEQEMSVTRVSDLLNRACTAIAKATTA